MDMDALKGAGAGFIVAGPLGAVAGAVAGKKLAKTKEPLDPQTMKAEVTAPHQPSLKKSTTGPNLGKIWANVKECPKNLALAFSAKAIKNSLKNSVRVGPHGPSTSSPASSSQKSPNQDKINRDKLEGQLSKMSSIRDKNIKEIRNLTEKQKYNNLISSKEYNTVDHLNTRDAAEKAESLQTKVNEGSLKSQTKKWQKLAKKTPTKSAIVETKISIPGKQKATVDSTGNIYMHVTNSAFAFGGMKVIKLAVDVQTGELMVRSKEIKDKDKDNLVDRDLMIKSKCQEHPNLGICKAVTKVIKNYEPENSQKIEKVVTGKIVEFFGGGDLDQKKFSQEKVVSHILDAAKGLHCLHSNGVVHRDIKPDNIMLRSPEQGPEQAVLIDFDMACSLDELKALEGKLKEAEKELADVKNEIAKYKADNNNGPLSKDLRDKNLESTNKCNNLRGDLKRQVESSTEDYRKEFSNMTEITAENVFNSAKESDIYALGVSCIKMLIDKNIVGVIDNSETRKKFQEIIKNFKEDGGVRDFSDVDPNLRSLIHQMLGGDAQKGIPSAEEVMKGLQALQLQFEKSSS